MDIAKKLFRQKSYLASLAVFLILYVVFYPQIQEFFLKQILNTSFLSKNGGTVTYEGSAGLFDSGTSLFGDTSSWDSDLAVGCYFCVYQEEDHTGELKPRCERLVRENKNFYSISEAVSLKDFWSDDEIRKKVCSCEYVDYEKFKHTGKGFEFEPFLEIIEILEITPECKVLNYMDRGCQRFSDYATAEDLALNLKSELAQQGFAGSIYISAYQTKNTIIREGWTDDKKQRVQPMCDISNQTIAFDVCAKSVEEVPGNCKTPGSECFVRDLDDARTPKKCSEENELADGSRQTSHYLQSCDVDWNNKYSKINFLKQYGDKSKLAQYNSLIDKNYEFGPFYHGTWSEKTPINQCSQ